MLIGPNIRRRLLCLAAALPLAGCVAETVERRRPRKGPVEEVGYVDFGGGRVRYSTEGWGWFVSGRRRHARRLMRKNCGKELKPEITDEYTREDADIAYSGDDLADEMSRGSEHFKHAPFQHFAYECRPKQAMPPPPAPSTGTATSPFFVVPARELLPGATVAAPVPDAAPAASTAPAEVAPSTTTAPTETAP